MKIIKDIVDELKDELGGAEGYAERAMKYKGVDDGLSAMYAEMAKEEMGHVDKLHGRAQEIIRKYRAEKGEPPLMMQAVWDQEHKEMMKWAAEIRAMIDMTRK